MNTHHKQLWLTVAWQGTHALAWFLAASLLLERLIPGAVLGYIPLFSLVPILLMGLTIQPAHTKRSRITWSLVDLGAVGLCLVARIGMLASLDDPWSWALGIAALFLVLACGWVLFEPTPQDKDVV